jgi:catechol 2,3-dioxygenase-like lactoylglutathione lyase family enzyme
VTAADYLADGALLKRARIDDVGDIRKTAMMTVFDHLGITIDDLPRATAQFHPVLEALGFTRSDADGSVSWYRDGEPELILFPAREAGTGPHRHGQVGWQHLAFAVDSQAEVDHLHAIAVGAGWYVVREPKKYPRFNDRYYASFVEDDNGIRLEFMYNPPRGI